MIPSTIMPEEDAMELTLAQKCQRIVGLVITSLFIFGSSCILVYNDEAFVILSFGDALNLKRQCSS